VSALLLEPVAVERGWRGTMSNDAVGFAAAVSSVPAAGMLAGSFLLLRLNVSPRTSAGFQNMSAGLLLGAIASELFPLLAQTGGAGGVLGTTTGFAAGLAVVFGTEKLGKWLEGRAEMEGGRLARHSREEAARLSSALLSSAKHHREHICEHLHEIASAIASVDAHAQTLSLPSTSAAEQELLAETIDEAVHSIQYKLDHARRLLEGAETGMALGLPPVDKAALQGRIGELKAAVSHLQEHFAVHVFDQPTVLEVHGHMGELDALLHGFHEGVQEGISTWRRRGPIRTPSAGARLPVGLVAAVHVDSFVDGFLIGISCAFSHRAGLVLAVANVLEMGFIGAAYASTVAACSGTSRRMRLLVVTTPPVLLLVSAIIGAALGDFLHSYPTVFVGFVAFGVVALLFLVTHELLIEAHEATRSESVIWINCLFFLGIYLVLLLEHLLPPF